MKSLLIYSGGLDSTTLLYWLKQQGEVIALSFDYGQRHGRELDAAKYFTDKEGIKHDVINLIGIFSGSALTGDYSVPHGHYADKSMRITVVPNRNMVMLSIAVSKAIQYGCNFVAYGAHSGDHAIYPDCRPEFIDALSNTIDLCDYTPPKLIAPFQEISKSEVVQIAIKLGVDIDRTWTCYEGGVEPCGKCGSCVERNEALSLHALNAAMGLMAGVKIEDKMEIDIL